MRIFRVFLLVFLSSLLVSCAYQSRYYRPNPDNPVFTVAVLPMYNLTNDVEGAAKVREEFKKRIQFRQYSVMALKDVDQILLDQMGITLGDQLEMTTPQKLGEVLGVDGVVYGYLLDFDDITTGVFNEKKVRAGFKLVETRTGSVIWSRGLGVKSILSGGGDAGAGVTVFKELMDSRNELPSDIPGIGDIPGLKDWRIIRAASTKKAGDAAAIALGEKLITKAFGVHLMLETDNMLNWITRDFPAGPGAPRALKGQETEAPPAVVK